MQVITAEGKIIDIDSRDEALETYRHSTSHLMALAVSELFPGVHLGIGPAISEGFFYDFERAEPFTQEDLERIEQKMRDLVKQDLPYQPSIVPLETAVEEFGRRGEKLKVELIKEKCGERLSCYRVGSLVDFCTGPHVLSTGKINPNTFKLLNISGAYWKGDANREQMQRIYGTAFLTEQELKEHLSRLEEAKRRDHRRLGRELELFGFYEIAPGAPFWLPKGMILYRELEKFIREELDQAGYQEISTPILVKKDLWEQSGHWAHYKDNMFSLETDKEIYSLKPMNCPESTFVYNLKLRSYRDLPLRFSELGRLHRNEIRGALGGLFRVRQFTQDDAHIYLRSDQILDEIDDLIRLIKKVYGVFGFEPAFKLSTKPNDAMGDPKLWKQAESSLDAALKRNHMDYTLAEGEGAFYGPKIDIDIRDALNRPWQLATIQLDLMMVPERFQLEYIDENNRRQRPVVIHRAIFGSFERFIGVLTEHFAGAFPVWLAPTQAVVIPISDKHMEYAKQVFTRLQAAGIRVALDDRNERVNYKIREAQMQKVPYMLVVGEREAKSASVSVRNRPEGDEGSQLLESFVEKIKNLIETKATKP